LFWIKAADFTQLKTMKSGNKEKGEMKNKYIHELKRLFSFMKPNMLPYSIGILGMSLISAGMAIVVAFALKNMAEAALSKSTSQLIQTGLMMLSMMLGFIVFVPALYFIYQRSIKRTMASIRLELVKNIERLPISFIENRHSGDFISRLNNDTQVMEVVFSENLLAILSTVTLGIGSILFMAQINWKLSILFVGISILMALINLLFVKPLRKLSDAIQGKMSTVTERLVDLLNGFSVIKMFHVEEKISGYYERENNSLAVNELRRINKYAFLEGGNYLLNMINFVGLISIGSVMVMEKVMDFGTLTAFVMLQMNVSNAFLRLSKYVPLLQSSLAGAARVFELQDVEKERANATAGAGVSPPLLPQEMVQFDHVYFNYSKNETILEDISFKARSDRMTAFIGPSGSGKSTIIKLLLGFYEPVKGDIIVAGKQIFDYSLNDLRNLIAYVPQESYLFDSTILENIRYGRIDASEDEIYEAARVANAHDFILKLPEKYNTMVGETGSKLSGGQRQRIAIARAILKNAPILLLDEATSSLDSESENLIQMAVDSLLCKKTVIVIAHRLSTIKQADKIYAINKGKLVVHRKDPISA
jgi:ATP-binding cassette, subfamily B, bacterial